MPHGNIDPMPLPPDVDQRGDLFARMYAAAHAEFTLVCAARGITITERDKELVDLAVVAGVVGALAVDREDEDSTRH